MALTAADVMQTQVITVSPVDPLHMVQRLFFEEEIHGAPVVDEEGRVRGMITIMDLIRAATEANESNGVDFIDVFEDIGVGGGWLRRLRPTASDSGRTCGPANMTSRRSPDNIRNSAGWRG